ncbi:SRPBCC family protein [Williamsia deligens]|uniref:SRPBCC family protein n=1 Tax=Williamsia deligens TaxID=321325 RepID=A0ABW3G6V9_9NOCA|nr:SRPBCC family protein [Williamsia deligens]MCP2193869.1 Polyketide cyclase / dehydrase and lipid transport [Williamsia deligens]
MNQPAVSTVEVGKHKVARRVTVHAPAGELFAMAANPHRHHELDGSGTVRDSTVKGPEKLSTGDKFSVGMKQFGVPYVIKSTATEIVDGTTVEWQHPMGHKWRWDFRETSPGTTEVTETFDYTTARSAKFLEITGYDKKNGEGIERTLTKLAQRYS